jgi:MazG family protein
MATLVGLGPGDPALMPLASWRLLETAGPVAVAEDDPLREWLGAHGIGIDPAAPVVAASGAAFRRLLHGHEWDAVVPAGAALADHLLAGALLDLQRLTERLRRDCPWDREQTAATIVPHTVEEAYEVAEAAASGPGPDLVGEVGDLLFQAYFLALLCAEQDAGGLAEVAEGITAKLVRRHPHVFGAREAETAGDVRRNWEQIKRDDEGREGIFHDVPAALPGLLHARKVQRRASAVGFDWPEWRGAWDGLESEVAELRAALDAAPEPRAEHEPDRAVVHEAGDLLFAAVNVARLANVDPEIALRASSDRFRRRVEEAERLAAAAGEEWTALAPADQETWYRRAKAALDRA